MAIAFSFTRSCEFIDSNVFTFVQQLRVCIYVDFFPVPTELSIEFTPLTEDTRMENIFRARFILLLVLSFCSNEMKRLKAKWSRMMFLYLVVNFCQLSGDKPI